MKERLKSPRFVLLFLVFFSVAAAALAAIADNPNQVYNALQRAYYLSAADAVWIRPGLNMVIQNVTLPADRRPVVTFRITDDKGQPLDRLGNLTPGSVTSNFMIAYIPANATQYVSYNVRTQTSPITRVSAIQATGESNGTYTDRGDGTYDYRFALALPENYDRTATHTIGIWSRRDLTEFGLSRYYVNRIWNFVPDGRQVTKIREVVKTASCNACHDPLLLHGTTGRKDVEVCILCHTPQTIDPDTGHTQDMKVLTHKIHMGANLPSVRAGTPYIIIGNQQSIHDYSKVHYPMDIRNCTSCHKDAAQVNNWLLNPTAETCGSCHDDVNFKSGLNHRGGPQVDNRFCAACHWPESGFEYDATIKGAHTPPYKSRQLVNPRFEIVSITNTAPGQRPVMTFRITDKDGKILTPSQFGSFSAVLAGPTSDYRWYVSESMIAAPYSGGVGTYTFTNAIPSTATGTYSVTMQGFINQTLNRGTTKEFAQRDAGNNVTRYFAVTGTTVTPRRTTTDLAKCLKCHDKLQLHGTNRNTMEFCVVCHNPATTDTARRPAAQAPAESIDMKIIAHRIHRGIALNDNYTLYGFGNVAHNYNNVHYPGDLRNCTACHTGTAYTVPLPSTATPSVTPRHRWNPTLPTTATCTGCHDSLAAFAHAFLNTAPFGESCAVCHKETASAAVSKVHAR